MTTFELDRVRYRARRRDRSCAKSVTEGAMVSAAAARLNGPGNSCANTIHGMERSLFNDIQLDRERCGLKSVRSHSADNTPCFIFNAQGLLRVEVARTTSSKKRRCFKVSSSPSQSAPSSPSVTPTSEWSAAAHSQAAKTAASISSRKMASSSTRPPGCSPAGYPWT